MLEIIHIPVLSDNYIYLLHETVSGRTAAVDPAEADAVLALLHKHGWTLDYIFNTHHHGDHIGGNRKLKSQTGCQIVAAKADRHRIPDIDIEVDDSDLFQFGAQSIKIIATPGHTSGHIVYYCPDSAALFCGDTLFSLGCGRLFEGSAEQMWLSLQKLKALPAETRIYCAHEYTQSNCRFALSLEADNLQLLQRAGEIAELRRQNLSTLPSTLGQEMATNPFLREKSATIRSSLHMSEQESGVAVFTRMRELKDAFR